MFKQKKGQILQCSNRKKDRYYNVQTEKGTDTTMFKQKKGQKHNDLRHTIQKTND